MQPGRIARGHGLTQLGEPSRTAFEEHADKIPQELTVAADPAQCRLPVGALALSDCVRRNRWRGMPRCPGHGRHGVEQFAGADGFADVTVHAGLQTAFAVALHGVSGHGKDRRVSAGRRLTLADGRRRLETVHVRHLHVHEHQVEGIVLQGRDGLGAVADHHDRMPLTAEQSQGQLLVERIVLRQKDVQDARRGSRRRRESLSPCRRALALALAKRGKDGLE